METQATTILESKMSRRQITFPEQLEENLKKATKMCVCERGMRCVGHTSRRAEVLQNKI